jgi:serine/threonine-protein kinase
MQVSEPPVSPRERNPAIPPALEAVVLRAMEKDPARRFANADEFIEALRGGSLTPIEVIPPAPPVMPVEDILEEDDRRGRRWWLWLLILLAVAAIAIGAYALLRPQEAKVPNVIGLRSATASQVLQNDGFEVRVNRVTNADVPRDRVFGQSPRPERTAEKGSTVTVNVSDGPGEVAVPSVTGVGSQEAQDQLRAAGLDPAVEKAFSDTVKKGQVIETSPPGGTTVERGTKVTLTVSKGPERVAVPDVTGETEDNARSALEGAGLRVGKVTEEESDQDPGTVIDQTPAAGDNVTKNTAVDLTVAKAVTIPDVVDLKEQDAKTQLESAGFTVRVRDQTVTDPAQVGIVLDQSPAADEARRKGSRVTIVVGRAVTATPTASPTTTPEA